MKKNAMLKIAAILMVAVLLTTCAISSTFAKYVTSKTVKSTGARVAAFGYELNTEITVDAEGQDAFFKEYAKDDDQVAGDFATVKSDAFVVAPGTTGVLKYDSDITASDKCEVAVKIVSDAKFELGAGFEDYCPLVFTIKNADGSIKKYATQTIDPTSDITNTAGLIAAINGALSFEKVLQPGVYAVDSVSVEDLFGAKEITWEWAFESTANTTAIDELDTQLGNSTEDLSIKFTLTQSITQID